MHVRREAPGSRHVVATPPETAAPSPQLFINFAHVIVRARIALAFAPWCERNIIQQYFPEKTDDKCVVEE